MPNSKGTVNELNTKEHTITISSVKLEMNERVFQVVKALKIAEGDEVEFLMRGDALFAIRKTTERDEK